MVALPDSLQIEDRECLVKVTPPKSATFQQAVKMVAGTALIMSAVGVWLLSAGAGDAAMQLIKLVFSFSLLGLGVMFISSMDQDGNEPEIEFDTVNRQLRIIECDAFGNPAVTQCHDLDSLSELSLKDGSLTARDGAGSQVVAVSITNKATVRALRAAMSGVG